MKCLTTPIYALLFAALLASSSWAQQSTDPSQADGHFDGRPSNGLRDIDEGHAEALSAFAQLQAEAMQAQLEEDEAMLAKAIDDETRLIMQAYFEKAGGWEKVSPLTDDEKAMLLSGEDLPDNWRNGLKPGTSIESRVYAFARPLPVGLRKLYTRPEGTNDLLIEDAICRIDLRTGTLIDVFRPTPVSKEAVAMN